MRCGNCKQDHPTAQAVRDCYSSNVLTADAPAMTEKQKAFIDSLVEDRDTSQLDGTLLERLLDVGGGKFVSRAEASALIEALMQLPKGDRADHFRFHETQVVLEDGVYFLNGVYFKVVHAIHGSGKQYAKRLDTNGDEPTWEYEGRGILQHLTPEHRINAEQAARFGHLYGRCIFCHIKLTDERSIHVGYGETCAGNNGLPWGERPTIDALE